MNLFSFFYPIPLRTLSASLLQPDTSHIFFFPKFFNSSVTPSISQGQSLAFKSLQRISGQVLPSFTHTLSTHTHTYIRNKTHTHKKVSTQLKLIIKQIVLVLKYNNNAKYSSNSTRTCGNMIEITIVIFSFEENFCFWIWTVVIWEHTWQCPQCSHINRSWIPFPGAVIPLIYQLDISITILLSTMNAEKWEKLFQHPLIFFLFFCIKGYLSTSISSCHRWLWLRTAISPHSVETSGLWSL